LFLESSEFGLASSAVWVSLVWDIWGGKIGEEFCCRWTRVLKGCFLLFGLVFFLESWRFFFGSVLRGGSRPRLEVPLGWSWNGQRVALFF